jgi:BlaI family transcriptional regulator, penicillinase repressor
MTMARSPRTDQLTPLELEIMKVLWQERAATVPTVHQRLQPDRPLAYTTVQTMMNVLLRKGKVRRVMKDRAYVYRPLLSRQQAISQAIGDMVERVFSGSWEDMVVTLLKTRRLTPEKIARLQELLDEAKEQGHGKH